MLRAIKEKIAICGTENDYFFSNETFNKLIKESTQIRLNDDGILDLFFENGEVIGVKINSVLAYSEGVAYVSMCYFDKIYQINTQLNSRDKICKIL